MKISKKQRMIILASIVFVLLSLWFVFGRNLDFTRKRTDDSTVMPEATGTTERISENIVVEQSFTNTSETIERVGIVFYRIQYLEGVNVVLELWQGNRVVASNVYPVYQIEGEHRTFIVPETVITDAKDKDFKIRIYAEDGSDMGLALMVDEKADSSYKFGSMTGKGTLCFAVVEADN